MKIVKVLPVHIDGVKNEFNNHRHISLLPQFSLRMEVASSRSDHLPTLSVAKTPKLSLLVKHHILAIDEAS